MRRTTAGLWQMPGHEHTSGECCIVRTVLVTDAGFVSCPHPGIPKPTHATFGVTLIVARTSKMHLRVS